MMRAMANENLPVLALDAPAEAFREALDAVGAFIVRSARPQDAVQALVDRAEALIALQLRRVGLEPSGDLQADFNRLCDHERALGAAVYDAIAWTTEYQALVHDPRVLRICGGLFGSEHVLCPHTLSWVRIDRKDETRHLFPWHQDYPYNLASDPTITTWMPLLPIDATMGRLAVVPGSHGQLQRLVASTGERYVRMPDVDEADLERRAVELDLDPGDTLFFHHFLLHRGGVNHSERARWVLNARYCHAADAAWAAQRWTYRRETSFELVRQRHPNHVVLEP
jgi:hypothetical protein